MWSENPISMLVHRDLSKNPRLKLEEKADVEEVVVVPEVAKLPKALKQLTIASFFKK